MRAISPKLKQAILAAEDSEFEQHFGPQHAAHRDGRDARHPGRGSRQDHRPPIPAQRAPARSRSSWRAGSFLRRSGSRSATSASSGRSRKALVAVQIEKRYTKSEIFTLYANQMYSGKARMASRARIADLLRQVREGSHAGRSGDHRGPLPDVAQCADSEHGPREAAPRLRARSHGRGTLHHPQGSRRRQGAADRAGGGAGATATPLRPTSSRKSARTSRAAHGAKQLYENGLSVQTALDVRLQEAATAALDAGLRRVDKRRGFRKPRRNIIAEGKSIDAFSSPALGSPDGCWQHRAGGRQRDRTERRSRIAHAGKLRVTIDKKGYRLDGQNEPHAAHRGAAISSRHALLTVPETGTSRDRHARAAASRRRRRSSRSTTTQARSGQCPAATASIAASSTARRRRCRQVGSAFKPIVYTARDRSRLHAASRCCSDTPATFSGGAGQPAYSPMNYDKKFEGPITLRHALENRATCRRCSVMEQLGPKQVIAYARRLGLESPLPPYSPSPSAPRKRR